MAESRVGELLRAYGVRSHMSVRDAARRCGVSHETVNRIMQPLGPDETRAIRKSSLDKIATGLGIPRDLLQREMMADAGFDIRVVSDSSVAEALAQMQGLSARDLATIQIELGRMQLARVESEAESDVSAAARPET